MPKLLPFLPFLVSAAGAARVLLAQDPTSPFSMPTTLVGTFILLVVGMGSLLVYVVKRQFDLLADRIGQVDKLNAQLLQFARDDLAAARANQERDREEFAVLADAERERRRQQKGVAP